MTKRAHTYRLYRQTKSRFLKLSVSLTAALVMIASSLGGALPLLFTQHAAAAGTVVVGSTNGAWQTSDTRLGGTVSLIPDSSAPLGTSALQLTTDSTNAAKAQLLTATNTKLADIAALSYYTKQVSTSSPSGDPSYQLSVDLNNDGTADTNLVYEPYWNGTPNPNTWQHWDVLSGKFWSSQTAGGLTAGAGGPPLYTIADVLAHDPSATVVGFGVNVGSYNPSYNVEVDDLVFNDTTYNFEIPTPTDVYVDPAYDAASAGSHTFGYDAFNNIQDGVNAVAVNGTVHVDSGSYAPATINKTISLKGAQVGVSPVDNNVRTHGALNESLIVGATGYSPSFNVTADGVTIDGFDFGPSVDGTTAGPIGIDLGSSDGATIKNTIFEHNQRGISLNGASNVTVSNDLVSNNNSASAANANAGIWGDNVNTITIANSELDGASNTAINLATGSKNITINANIFKDDGNTAVIWQDSDVTFSNNYGRGFDGSGLFITGSSNVSVTKNDLSLGTGFNGISISTASGTPSSAVSITGNTLDGFSNAINVAAASALSDQLGVHANKLGDNANAGVNASSNATSLVNATSNWWGNATGPNDPTSNDGSTPATNPGSGSVANGAVNYGPWCTVADCSLLSDQTPAAPTNLNAKFQYDISNVANGATLNIAAKSGGNNLELLWDAPAGLVTGYHVLSTYPNGSTNVGYQGPNTNGWLVPNGFGQHGNGAYTYQVVAVNSTGESNTSETFTIYYDTTPPTASFTTAPANASFVNGNFAVAGTAHDNVGLHDVAFDIRTQNGSTWVAGCIAGGTTLYSGTNQTDAILSCTMNTANLVNGTTYMLRIHDNDNAGYGNVNADAVRYVTFNTAAPAAPTNLTAMFQYDGSDINNGSVLNVNAKPSGNNLELMWNTPASTDWVTGYQILTTYPNGSQQLGYQGPNTNAWLIYNGFGQHGDGAYKYQVIAVNPNGQTMSSETFTLIYDTTAPTVTVTPVAGSTLHGTETFTITVHDANLNPSTLKSIYVYLYDNAGSQKSYGAKVDLSSGTGTFTVDTTTLNDGLATLDVGRLADAAGNLSGKGDTYFKNYTIDNTPPTVPIVSLKDANGVSVSNGGFVSTQGFRFTLPSGVARYQLKYWNNIVGSPFNGKANAWNPSNLSSYMSNNSTTYTDTFTQGEGTHYFEFSACDAVGNCSVYSPLFTVTYDKTAPVVAITAPSTNSTVSGTTTISGTVKDANPDHYYLVVKNSANTVVAGPGTVYAATVSNFSWDTTKVANGTYTIDLEARDKAGNKDASSIQTVTVTVDNVAVAPAVSITPIVDPIITPSIALFSTITPAVVTTSAPTTTATISPTVGTTNPQVLGASTDTGSNGKVKGDATTTPNTVAVTNAAVKKQSSYLWWWLAGIAALAIIFFIFAKLRKHEEA